MEDVYAKALEYHKSYQGKIEVALKVPLESKEELSLAYTPGVAEPCRKIQSSPSAQDTYTWRGNTIAIVTDGTAVLGLGDIGPKASLPVMEGKAALFKKFGNINAVPLCIDTKDSAKIIEFCHEIAPSFGGINLEDISAPRCVTIERTLIKELNIPVFHDDQHGTAIVVSAAIINALKLVGKKPCDVKAVVSGAGAAGSSIIHSLYNLGIRELYAFNINGIITGDDYDSYDFLTRELTALTNPSRLRVDLREAMKGADIFIGVSAPRLVDAAMIKSMASKSIVFAMANPEPEISYEEAKEAGAYIIGTGRSDYPNQVNNLLAFPAIFRGALDAKATKISEGMKSAASKALSSLISEDKLSPSYVIPNAFDEGLVSFVAKAVAREARIEGLC